MNNNTDLDDEAAFLEEENFAEWPADRNNNISSKNTNDARATLNDVRDGQIANRRVLPKGSAVFQRVLDEIRQEQENETKLITDSLSAFADAKKKHEAIIAERNARNSKWKLASVKMLTKRRSTKDLLFSGS
ncbi:hypothetical protein DPMN_081212 [Dreissena polymorpha]|uniref:Uncharacterized protein n=1 Tax=Dreissena polymorpha TaxID=45954 RepID=A0A9D4BG31_DREPO|nr:hypothetical protein DPMN_081212 [Dreissena polymorpha]